MSRKVTIFTGQWADLPLEEVCRKMHDSGYDGLELACWGDHFDVFAAAESKAYCDEKLALLRKYDLNCWAISNHLAGQLICDPNNDKRSNAFAPAELADNGEAQRDWAVKSMIAAAKAAKNMGVSVVNGFTGSPVWHLFYSFPPVDAEDIASGYKYFAAMFNPILDEFQKQGVRFALEVHPTEIAYDIYTAKCALQAIGNRPEFGFNFDPSHLIWQGVDPVKFLRAFPDRIFHCHIKDAAVTLDGESSILSSHLNFGDHRRGWDFRSPGHGEVDFESIIRELNRIGYTGPLSVEWEDCGMDREYGARDAAAFTRNIDFSPSNQQFDSVFDR